MASAPSEVKLNNAELNTKSEMLQSLKLDNHSFSSVEEDSKSFKMMFPDSKMTEKYQQITFSKVLGLEK